MARLGSRCGVVLLALLVACCHLSVATILVETESRLCCKCVKTISTYIRPAKLESLLIYPAGIACRRPEIIVTIKKTKKVICIDPKMKWVERIMKSMQTRYRNETSS